MLIHWTEVSQRKGKSFQSYHIKNWLQCDGHPHPTVKNVPTQLRQHFFHLRVSNITGNPFELDLVGVRMYWRAILSDRTHGKNCACALSARAKAPIGKNLVNIFAKPGGVFSEMKILPRFLNWQQNLGFGHQNGTCLDRRSRLKLKIVKVDAALNCHYS